MRLATARRRSCTASRTARSDTATPGPQTSATTRPDSREARGVPIDRQSGQRYGSRRPPAVAQLPQRAAHQAAQGCIQLLEVGFNRALASNHHDIQTCAFAGGIHLSRRLAQPASNPVSLHRAAEAGTDRISKAARLARRLAIPRSDTEGQRTPRRPNPVTKHGVEIRLATQTLISRHRLASSASALRSARHAYSSRKTRRGRRSDDRQSSPPPGATAFEHRTPATAGHSLEESMLPLARYSLRLIRAFRHQFPHHITGHTSPSDGESRTSGSQYTPAPDLSRVDWTAQPSCLLCSFTVVVHCARSMCSFTVLVHCVRSRRCNAW